MTNRESLEAELQDNAIRTRIATELDKNFLVEAAAGTGKTTSLVNRMVSLVMNEKCGIHQIAAVTFTRKAAAELRERFQSELRTRASSYEAGKEDEGLRLSFLADHAHQAFVGTIHSFCAAILRERPVEFDVDPDFRELTEAEDAALREQAWQENIADLIANNDPLILKLQELEIDRDKLKSCFGKFIDYRDVEEWPVGDVGSFDLQALQDELQRYIAHMKNLAPSFLTDRHTDKLMDRYDEIIRASRRPHHTMAHFFHLLEFFDRSPEAVPKWWHDKAIAKKENGRWDHFRMNFAKPGLYYWCNVRYEFVIRFIRRAVKFYERLKSANGGLDFQDLLLKVARGLSKQPDLRRYFQSRFPRLLVDEFQDTDPIQAEVILFLTSQNVEESDWTKCVPVQGALFLVGDPKQSIYRFRRGDIVTFNRVKQIIEGSEGEVLALTKNFRSQIELVQWNNKVYRSKFGDVPTSYSPAAEDMIHGRKDLVSPDEMSGALTGIYRLTLPDANIDDATAYEAESIAKFIRHSIDVGLQVHRTQGEQKRGKSPSVLAGDFLIVPWGKKNTNVYVAALERYGVPYAVSGGNPLKDNPELSFMIDCLRCIDDPSNQVHYLTVLRNYFGFSDRDLFLLKSAGGLINYSVPVPERLNQSIRERLNAISKSFQKYQQWLRVMPYATGGARIAEDLGLLMASAATSEGNMRAGGLFKSIELLREQSWDFDSATDLIQFLEEIKQAEDTDGCSAFAPSANVVKIMNLHKAKGLEAPIVFLAGASNKYKGAPNSHISRTGSRPVGYMGMTVPNGKYHTKDFATPADWSNLQAEERRFLDAEHDRLLYVATTRAACAMIISVGTEGSNWSSLHPHLADAPELSVPSAVSISVSQRDAKPISLSIPISRSSIDSDRIEKKWSRAMKHSYSITTAKKLGLKGHSRPTWKASGDFGYEWGSAVHELLEFHQKSPDSDLRNTAHRLTQEYHLGEARVEELFTTVRSVSDSEVWRRARASNRCFSELPIETFAADKTTGIPTLIRGVIDLIFEEPDGWVIVDYKTDDITSDQIESAVDYYRGQLTSYAEHWTNISKFSVKSAVLYFTRRNCFREIGL